MVALFCALAALQLPAREKNGIDYGMGLIVNIPFPESDVTQVVQEVVQNGLIRGTKEYNKDEYVAGATAASSTRAFSAWTEGGQVFYKVREHALDPRNFKDSGDVGTLAVRYVIQPQGQKNTVLRINAVFMEDFRRSVHSSNGSVESAEYKDIHDRLDAIASMKAQTSEAERENHEQRARISDSAAPAPGVSSSRTADASSENSMPSSEDNSLTSKSSLAVDTASQNLDERVLELRKQVERRVRPPGAPLKSAPFHTASTLQLLGPGTEVLIVIRTPYWLGIETRDGQHGWVLGDQLEFVP